MILGNTTFKQVVAKQAKNKVRLSAPSDASDNFNQPIMHAKDEVV